MIPCGLRQAGVPRILEYYPHSVYRFTPNFIRLVLPYAELVEG